MARRNRVREEIEVTEAIGYIRVSTQEQADSGLGLEAQKARIEAYCVAQGWKLVSLFTEEGVSAKTLQRPALTAAIDALRPGRVLVALKLDRMTRSVRDVYTLDEMTEGRGAAWVSIVEKIDTTTAAGRMFRTMLAAFAEFEREQTAERTCAALLAKKARGERLGTTPLGYRTVETPEGRRVEADIEEQKTVRMARELRGAGLSLRAIARELTEAGRPTKRGGRWQAETVAYLIAPRYLEEIAV